MANVQEMINIPVVLSKKVDNVLYNLMVRTITDNVYHGDTTLTEILQLIETTLRTKADGGDVEEIKNQLKDFFADSPEDYQTLADVINYINSCNNSITELKKLLELKVDTDTFDKNNENIANAITAVKDEFYRRLEDTISDTELTAELEKITNSLTSLETRIRQDMYKNIITKGGDIPPEDLVDNGYWIRIEG